MQKILLLQCAGLGHGFLKANRPDGRLGPLAFRPIRSVFPALTCTVQATMRTASPPSSHGMVGNGFFSRSLGRPLFWEQSSQLYDGPRIWDAFRKAGHTVGQLFWQQSLGEDSDVVVSPAPIHKHGGGMIQGCYSRPAGLYEQLVRKIGSPFRLRWYWGPLAGMPSTRWIGRALGHVMNDPAPDLLLGYLPHLDYALQRNGPDSPRSAAALDELSSVLEGIVRSAEQAGYGLIVFGDYAIGPVRRYVRPNRALRRAGLFATRRAGGMLYPDFPSSRAFAVVDHQVAHVVVPRNDDVAAVKKILSRLPGVQRVVDMTGAEEPDLRHARCGRLLAVAEHDAWMAYSWWDRRCEAPDYARHVDIHNKPGFDPCELFFGLTPLSISTQPSRIRGSHGLIGPGHEAAWAAHAGGVGEPESLLELSECLRDTVLRKP